MDYVVEVSCGTASMVLTYDDPSVVKEEIVFGSLQAMWLSDAVGRSVRLTPEDSEVVRLGSSELVCLQGDEVTFSVKARNRLFDGPLSSISTRALAPPTQVRELEDHGGRGRGA